MSPDNSDVKDETQSRKTTSARPQEPTLECPRCASPNTKFCYYNNYSLSQPRHFCKTCRRYWTKGGALRSVPIGGGCRKGKKVKSSTRLSGYSNDSNGSSTDNSGLKFFQGISPAMDFQLGGNNFPSLHSFTDTTPLNQFSSFGDISKTSGAISSSPCYNFDPSAVNPPPLMGINFPLSSTIKRGDHGKDNPAFPEIGSLNLASSMESLSSINQDRHRVLQKQRLSMLYVGDNLKDVNNSFQSVKPIVEKPQPILFQNMEISKPDESCGIKTARKDGGVGNLSTEWFFGNSYATNSQAPGTSSTNVNENGSSWSGIQAWSDMSQFSSLP